MSTRILIGCALALAFVLAASPVAAAVIAPSPGRQVALRDEAAWIVFDPLSGTQTIVVQHTFEGTDAPFGLLIPTPRPARARVASERLRKGLREHLHPRARAQRSLDIDFYAWSSGCLVRPVGDGLAPSDSAPASAEARATITPIGSAPEPLHDWMLSRGFTVAPAQAAWLAELRRRDWSVLAVEVKPPKTKGLPAAELRGPVLVIEHDAESPVYAAGDPPFALAPGETPRRAPLELAILTEWPAGLEHDANSEPFYADAFTTRQLQQLGRDVGGLPWGFRRDGTLTAFRLQPSATTSVLQITRLGARPSVRPTPTRATRLHSVEVPLEPVLAGAVLLVWWGLRRRRRPISRGLHLKM